MNGLNYEELSNNGFHFTRHTATGVKNDRKKNQLVYQLVSLSKQENILAWNPVQIINPLLILLHMTLV